MQRHEINSENDTSVSEQLSGRLRSASGPMTTRSSRGQRSREPSGPPRGSRLWSAGALTACCHPAASTVSTSCFPMTQRSATHGRTASVRSCLARSDSGRRARRVSGTGAAGQAALVQLEGGRSVGGPTAQVVGVAGVEAWPLRRGATAGPFPQRPPLGSAARCPECVPPLRPAFRRVLPVLLPAEHREVHQRVAVVHELGPSTLGPVGLEDPIAFPQVAHEVEEAILPADEEGLQRRLRRVPRDVPSP